MWGPKGAEGFVRTVAGRGKPVGAQADPGQEGDERDPVVELRVVEVAGRAEQKRRRIRSNTWETRHYMKLSGSTRNGDPAGPPEFDINLPRYGGIISMGRRPWKRGPIAT